MENATHDGDSSAPPDAGTRAEHARTGDLSPAEFDQHARAALDWMSRYLRDVEQYPVLARTRPGEVRHALPAEPPLQAEPLADVLADFERTIIPGITHWNHPGFMAYFAVTGSAPGIIGEMLTAALNVNGMLWRASPALTELEEVTVGWLRGMLGLPDGWFGMITDTASMSTMLALAAAREAPAELRIRELGLAGRAELPVLRVYTSRESHSSVEKACLALGIGSANVVKIEVDDALRMRVDALRDAVARDRAAGHHPLAIVATVGTTGTTSIDPVAGLAGVARDEGMWLHVDAAYAGVAAIVPELRWVLDGAGHADSLVVNPHKWLFTPIDCSVLYTKRPDVLRHAFSLVPEYLTSGSADDVVNAMDYGVQLGRRFRALKLWMVIRAFGVEGLAARIREHVRIAQELARWAGDEPGWQVVAPHPLSLVCLRFQPDGMSDTDADALNARIMDRVNASGEIFLSHTRVHGRNAIRVAIGNMRTTEAHVRRAWELLRSAAEELRE